MILFISHELSLSPKGEGRTESSNNHAFILNSQETALSKLLQLLHFNLLITQMGAWDDGAPSLLNARVGGGHAP